MWYVATSEYGSCDLGGFIRKSVMEQRTWFLDTFLPVFFLQQAQIIWSHTGSILPECLHLPHRETEIWETPLMPAAPLLVGW